MKQIKQSFLKYFGIFLISLVSLHASAASSTSVQVIHNSPGAPAVDVWVNGSTVLSGVTYRQASSFLDLGAGGVTTVQIAVTGSNPYNVISTDVVTLTSGLAYRAIATGVVGSVVAGQEFDVTYFEASTMSNYSNLVSLDIHHSSPDAPTVGVVARGVATLVSAFSFKDDPTNVEVAASSYILDVNAGSATGSKVKSYSVDLSGFSGNNLAVLASGLLSGTPGFGLIAYPSNGGNAIELNELAKVQVIHNSPNAPAVDIWVNGMTVAGGVVFRKASGFLDVPMDAPTTIQIAISGSNPYDIVSTDIRQLESGESYRAIATGVVGSAVPGQGFTVTFHAATTTTSGGNTGLDIYHSSPDAPAVGVVARGVATLVNAFAYKDAAAHVSVPSTSYVLDIRLTNASGSLVTSFGAPLAAFAGKNIAVLASGLLNGTPAFGLVAIAEDGSEIVLPEPSPAKVQVIHNSPGAPAVDVWVNGTTVLSGVTYRQASGFLNVGVMTFPTTIQIAVTGSSPYTIVSTDILTLTSGVSYRAIATGIVGSTVAGQEFDVTFFGATTTTTSGNTGLDIYHSSPNAPAVGVVAKDVATLVGTFLFKEAAAGISVPSTSYTININATNASGSTLFAYTAPLGGFAGKNIAVIAGGIVGGSTATGFGLFAVADDGTVVILPLVVTSTTGIATEISTADVTIYPNPTDGVVNISSLETGLTYALVSTLGETRYFTSSTFDVSGLPAGLYVVRVFKNGSVLTSKKLLVK